MFLSSEYFGKKYLLLTKIMSFGKNIQNALVVSDVNLSGIIISFESDRFFNNSYQLTKKLQKFSFLFYKNLRARKLRFYKKMYANKIFLKVKDHFNNHFFMAFYLLLLVKWKLFTRYLLLFLFSKTIFKYFLTTKLKLLLFSKTSMQFYLFTRFFLKIFMQRMHHKLKYKSKMLYFNKKIVFIKRLYYKVFRVFKLMVTLNNTLIFFSHENIFQNYLRNIHVLSKKKLLSSMALGIRYVESSVSARILSYLFLLKIFFYSKDSFIRKIFFSKYYSKIFALLRKNFKKRSFFFLKFKLRRLRFMSFKFQKRKKIHYV